jgi:hypothetical protein
LPKLRLVGFDPSAPPARPVPDRGIVSVGFDPFDVTVTFPLALPADAGVNFTLKVATCPGVRVTGGEMPLALKPVPLAATPEIVTLLPPVFVRDSVSASFAPTTTLPKLRLVGFAPTVPGVTPVPVSGIVSVGFVAVEVTVTLPVALPAEAGSKPTLKVAPCPAVKVSGAVMPLMLNPVPLAATAEIVTLVVPVFVTVSVKPWVTPTWTLPKLRLAGFDPSAPAVIPVPLSGMVSVAFDAFDETVRFPVALPADAGANFTLKVVPCPAAKVTGAVIPLTLNPVPLAATAEIVTLDPPVLVTVSDSD